MVPSTRARRVSVSINDLASQSIDPASGRGPGDLVAEPTTYTGVRWDWERSGTALVGRLAAPLDPTACRVSARSHRIAYQTQDFREYMPEIVMDEHGPVVLVRCEELDAESGRWEPFTPIVWSHR
jgi:hypothetical protein